MTDKDKNYLCCFQVVDSLSSRILSSGDFTFTYISMEWSAVREELVSTIKDSFIKNKDWNSYYYVQILSICKLH